MEPPQPVRMSDCPVCRTLAGCHGDCVTSAESQPVAACPHLGTYSCGSRDLTLKYFLTNLFINWYIFYITGERERNVLFNDALNTFYLRLYGVRHMVKDHSDSEK